MSRIDELIDELCSDGVSFFELGEVSEIKRGTSITKTAVVDGDVPVIAGGRTPAYFHNKSNRDGQTIVIAGSGAYAGFVSWWDQPIFVSDAFSIKVNESITAKYCYYWLQSMQVKLHELKSGGGVPHIYPRDVSPLRIPVPPLEVQREIVKVLDAFTELGAELEAELEARQKQYQYYRDELLSFEGREDVRWATLGEICQINRGRVMSKDYLRDNEGQYPVYSSQTANGGVFGYINSFDYDFESITWTTDGANAGSVFYHADEQFSITNVCGLLKVVDSSSLSTKFLYYILVVTTKRYVNEGMGNPKLMSNVMSQIKVPIPPIEEQVHIASILDKFDALVNDISSGLPAEIAARQKQYAYYRDRLLSFKEAA